MYQFAGKPDKSSKKKGEKKKLPKKNEVSGFLNTAQHLCAILM